MKRCLFFFIAALSVMSCSSPIMTGGLCSIVVDIGGAVPRMTAPANGGTAGGSRLVLAGTATVRIRATGDGVDGETTAAYAGPGTRVALGSLPVGKDVTISVETLGPGGQPLTSWTDTMMLSVGVNELSARLSPDPASVISTPSTLLNLASVNLTRGSAAFYEVTFSPADAPDPVNEYQLLANTGSFRSMWLGAYDQDWNPLPVVAGDGDDGWVVIQVAQGGQTLHLAVTAPDGDRGATLQARPAVFFGNSLAGTGTSANPLQDSAFSSYTIVSGESLFFAGGRDYPISMAKTVSGDTNLYGGFLPGGWTARDFSPATDSRVYVQSGTDTAIDLSGTADCFLDGMTVHARVDPGMPGMPGDRAVNAASTGSVVIRDCTLLGPANRLNVNTGSRSVALSIEAGNPQVVRCRIDGGYGVGGVGEAGITVSGGRPFIYGCEVSGGGCGSSGASTFTCGVDIAAGASAVITGCSIFGGSSTTTSTTSDSGNAFGVNVGTTPSAPVIIANSVISGGFSSGMDPSSPGFTYGIYSAVNTFTAYPVVVNCTIDAGRAVQTGAFGTIAAIYSSANSGYMSASGNVLLVSSVIPTAFMVRIGSTDAVTAWPFQRFAGNTAFGPLGQANCYRVGNVSTPLLDSPTLLNFPDGGIFSTAAYTGNETWLSAPQVTAVFASFDMSGVAGGADDFSRWLGDNDFRPSASGAPYFAGAYNPVTTSDIPGADLVAYPELALDRAGRARPATGSWSRGAYEP